VDQLWIIQTETRWIYPMLVRKSEETTRRHKQRRENNIKMDLKYISCKNVNWIRPTWRTLLNKIINLHVPQI
jgi:hypothetical protein